MGLLDGVFGKKKSGFDEAFKPYERKPYDTPGYGDGLPQNQPAEPARIPFSEGGKPHGWDWAGLALSAVGDSLAQRSGGQAWSLPMQFEGVQRARAAKDAAAAKQEERDYDRSEWDRRQEYEADHKAAPAPYRFEDNAGNVWERGEDGENKRIFTDVAPKTYLQDGQVINVPNPFMKGADLGADLPQGWQTEEPQGSVAPPNGLNVPQSGASTIRQSLISTFGPLQGEQKYRDWLRTNNVSVGGR